jgi:hypothetical protein
MVVDFRNQTDKQTRPPSYRKPKSWWKIKFPCVRHSFPFENDPDWADENSSILMMSAFLTMGINISEVILTLVMMLFGDTGPKLICPMGSIPSLRILLQVGRQVDQELGVASIGLKMSDKRLRSRDRRLYEIICCISVHLDTLPALNCHV